MEERSKTIMCSVLFLDIVEYSKKSVSGQISLKERFNDFLSLAIRDVPMDDRIILDTGDGAALSFLGDVEDALQVALSLRESLRSEAAHMDPPLLVRMGINLGPVRLVKDINGQPNIVGDGINVAQRIMAFSDPGQILVSRSYFDAVSRLSPEYGEMFHYQGSRTDKHVREHEVYAIGYPGEFTTQQPAVDELAKPPKPRKPPVDWGAVWQRVTKSWQQAAKLLGGQVLAAIEFFRKATPRQRAAYGGGAAAAVLAVALIAALTHRASAPEATLAGDTPAGQTASTQTVADAGHAAEATSGAESKAAPPSDSQSQSTSGKPTTHSATKPSTSSTSKPSTRSTSKPSSSGETTTIFGLTIPAKGKPGYVVVSCLEGSTVFVDGFTKGTVGKTPLRISVDPGKHRLNITHTSKASVYSGIITVKTGETIRLSPGFCK